jgi:hypothetical protein
MSSERVSMRRIGDPGPQVRGWHDEPIRMMCATDGTPPALLSANSIDREDRAPALLVQ